MSRRLLLLGGNAYADVVQTLGWAAETAGFEVCHLPRAFFGDRALTAQVFAGDYCALLGTCLYWDTAPQVAELVAAHPALKLFWNFDDPTRHAKWGQALERDIAAYDRVLTSSWDLATAQWYYDRGKPCERFFCPVADRGPSGAWPGLFEVLLVGTNYSREEHPGQPFTRQEVVDALRARGVAVACYGAHFGQELPPQNQFAFYRSAGLNLNQHLVHARWLNFRDGLLGMAGVPHLCDRNPGTLEVFAEDEALYYAHPEEAAEKAVYYLAHPAEAQQRAERAQQTAQHWFSLGAVGKRLALIIARED